MPNKIILAGGSGYLGQVLATYYRDRVKKIIILSRNTNGHAHMQNVEYVKWDGRTGGSWTSHLEDSDVLINLSGKNVNCRYTEKNRKEIFSSRLESTAVLGKAIAKLVSPPKLWINLASATIYRHAEDRPQSEVDGDMGSGFSVEVCKAWEKIFMEAHTPRTRKVILRTGIVIGKKDEVIPKLINLTRFGLGGHIGTGEQYVSWIHEQDFARVTEWLYYHGHDGDIYNCTAPGAVRNHELMQIIRTNYGIPFGLPSPKWLLEFGAAIIGTETELVLKSRWVYPKKLLDAGFHFQFPEAPQAINEILSSRA